MLAEISAGFGSLKALKDLVQGLNAASTQQAINEVKIALQDRIFEAQEALFVAQEAHAAALQRIRDLEEQIVQFENWNAEKQKYKLHQFPFGTFAYAEKPTVSGGEPTPYLCAYCFEDRLLSILQREGPRMLKCHRCGSEIRTEEAPPPPRPRVQRRERI